MENNSELWLSALPLRKGDVHKYDFGHAVIYGAPQLTGATRLAAAACARVGAGLTSVLCLSNVAQVYRETLPAHIMVREDLDWSDARVSAKLYGSGGLPCDPDFEADIPIVLDADGLQELPDALSDNYILTPHEGEFAKAFPDIEGSRVEKATKASKQLGAVVLLKGEETVIVHPDGRIVVNNHASSYLATAGSGDVLAGMIVGLVAQGMPAFEACCAAVWIHGEAAIRFGVGLVASDIPEIIPEILQDLT